MCSQDMTCVLSGRDTCSHASLVISRATCFQVADNHVVRYVPPEMLNQNEVVRRRWKEQFRPLGGLVVGADQEDPTKVRTGAGRETISWLLRVSHFPIKHKVERPLAICDPALSIFFTVCFLYRYQDQLVNKFLYFCSNKTKTPISFVN